MSDQDKLQFVVLYLGQSKLDAVVVRNGKPRRVTVTWFTAETTDVPPEDWLSTVSGELDYQDSDKSNELPFLPPKE